MSKAYAPKQSAEVAEAAQSAAHRSPGLTGPEPAFTDNRAETLAQRELAEAIKVSPRVLQQKAFFDSVRNSPYPIAQRTPIIQRVMDAAQWDRLSQSLAAGPAFAKLRADAGGVIWMLRRHAGNYQVRSQANPAWVAVTQAQLQNDYTWLEEEVRYNNNQEAATKKAGADNERVNADNPAFTITDYRDQDLSLVHHTAGEGVREHLTVENAHISALHHVMDLGSIGDFKKDEKNKPQHEAVMKAYGSAPVDNLNFYRVDAGDRLGNLTLTQYLRVISHAMAQIAGVPPVYGVEVIRAANKLAAAKNLDPAQLYLPKGEGMETHLFRAALNMHKMGLIVLSPAVVADFGNYAQGTPQLTSPEGVVVRSGEAQFNKLQSDLIAVHLPALIAYLNTL